MPAGQTVMNVRAVFKENYPDAIEIVKNDRGGPDRTKTPSQTVADETIVSMGYCYDQSVAPQDAKEFIAAIDKKDIVIYDGHGAPGGGIGLDGCKYMTAQGDCAAMAIWHVTQEPLKPSGIRFVEFQCCHQGDNLASWLAAIGAECAIGFHGSAYSKYIEIFDFVFWLQIKGGVCIDSAFDRARMTANKIRDYYASRDPSWSTQEVSIAGQGSITLTLCNSH